MNLQASPADIVAALDHTSARRTTPNGAGQMTWRIWGKGYPLVLLHGGSGTWMHFVRNIEPLARDFMVIAGDQPGFGDSDLPAEPVTPDSLAAIVHAGVEQILGLQRHFTYIGFSMGAAVAGHAAPLAGSRLDRIILAGGAGLKLPSPPMAEMKSWRHLPTEEEKRAAHRHNLEVLMLHDPARIDALALYIQARGSAMARTRRINISSHGRLPERLAESRAAISSIWGEFDAIAQGFLEERRALIDRIRPGSTFDVVPGAGHWVQYEAAETFNRLVRDRVGAR